MNRIVLTAALVCAVSPGFAHKVRVDFNHGIHFSCYKTYRWVQSPDAPSSQAQFPNQLMQERIARSVDEALAARGLQRVTTGGDLLISYQFQVTRQPQYFTFSDGWGPGWDWGWGWGNGFAVTTAEDILQGTLVLDMVDANQQQLVFQGTSTQAISSRPEKNSRKLIKAVNEIFQRYPPRQ